MFYKGLSWAIEGQVEGYTIRERFDLGSNSFDLNNACISKNGKRYNHYCIPLHTDEEGHTRTPQQLAQVVFDDFIKTAKTGSGLRSDYVRDYCKGESKRDISDAWRDYTRAYEGLMRLDPSGYKALLS